MLLIAKGFVKSASLQVVGHLNYQLFRISINRVATSPNNKHMSTSLMWNGCQYLMLFLLLSSESSSLTAESSVGRHVNLSM